MTSILITYLLILLLVFVFQRKLIYLPEKYRPIDTTELSQRAGMKPWPSADDYKGFININESRADKGVILIFHGNAGSAIGRFFYFIALERLGYKVIVAEYPGYGGREGNPSEKELIADGIETAQKVAAQFGGPIYLWGESLGGGVATGIIKSGRVPVKGLILLMPFDNLPNIAQTHYWLFMGKWLTRDKFDNAENLRGYKGKTAVILAENDEIIPPNNTLRLYDALTNQKQLWVLKNASHNDLPIQPDEKWWLDVMSFVSEGS